MPKRWPLINAFDVVIMSDLVGDALDVQKVLEQARELLAPHGRL